MIPGETVPVGGRRRMSSRDRRSESGGREDSPLSGMRLGELIDEVQDRLASVARAQARVQPLLDAFLSVSTGLDLQTTLRRIVEVALDLVDARYGALGVLDQGGGLAAFIHVGVDDDLATRMGSLPEGKGVLGQLITEPHPLRIGDLSDHPSSVGFPPHHPPMGSFLGVPVLVRGEAYGNLYMPEKVQGECTGEEEAVLTALAGAAGIAIDNARLYEQSEVRRRWLSAVSDVRAVLLEAGSADEALGLIAERVRELTGADATWLLTGPGIEGVYTVSAQSGAGLQDLVGQHLSPRDHPVLAAVEDGDGAVVTLDLTGMDFEQQNPGVDWGPCLCIPLRGTHAEHTVTVVARRAGSATFDASLPPLITAFADQASV